MTTQHFSPRGGEGDDEGAAPVPTSPGASTQAVDDLLDDGAAGPALAEAVKQALP